MSGWTNIGTGAGWLHQTNGISNYVVISRPLVDGGETLLWNYTPHDWRIIGGHFSMVLPTGNAIYAVSYDQQYRVMEWTGASAWREIGRPFGRIFGGKLEHSTTTGLGWSTIYGIHAVTGNIFRYEGTPGAWTEIGGPGFTFTEVYFPVRQEAKLYGLSPDKTGVWEYTGIPWEWRQIGGPASWIIGGMIGQLLAIDPITGLPYLYQGQPMSWTQLALASNDSLRFQLGGSFFFGAQLEQSDLYYIPPNRSAIYGQFTWTGFVAQPIITNSWQFIGGPLKTVIPIPWSNRTALVAIDNDGNVNLFERSQVSFRRGDPPAAVEGDEYFFQIQAEGGSPPYSFISEGGSPPLGTTLYDDGRVQGRVIRTGRYGLTVRVVDAMASSATAIFFFNVGPMRPATPPPPPPPPVPVGYSRIRIFNCRVGGLDHPRPTVHIYSRNLTTRRDWNDHGTLASSYNKRGTCPDPESMSITVTLDEGLHYIIAIDETLTGCDGNPNNPYCNGGHFTVQGDPKGSEISWWPGP
ncbi:MAG TPA: hypothetical protein VF487_12390 [Chitinophagaceae bacterium]